MIRMRLHTAHRQALLALLAAAAALLAPAPAQAAPRYDVKATWGNTNLPPGGEGQFLIQARNLSEQTGTKRLTIADELPAGVKATEIRWQYASALLGGCSGVGTGTVTCSLSNAEKLLKYAPGRGELKDAVGDTARGATPSGYLPTIEVGVEIEAGASGTATNEAILYGGNGVLPGGGPCAQSATELETLPPCAEDEDQVPFSAIPSSFGIVPGSFAADLFSAEYPAGSPSRAAGAHPFELRFGFDLNARLVEGPEWPKVISDAPIKTAVATLPLGMIGNPEALPKCDPVRFAEEGSTLASTRCPPDTQVGYVNVPLAGKGGAQGLFTIPNAALSRVPVYSLIPPKGQVADFAFNGLGYVQAHIYPRLAPSPRGYVVKTLVPDITASQIPRGSEAVFWGVPADPAHDWARYYPEAQPTGEVDAEGHEILLAAGAPSEGPLRPFFTNPTDCGEENGAATLSVDSYADPGNFTAPVENASPDDVTGCEDPRFHFGPALSLVPTDRQAGAATGLSVSLKVPQRSDEVKAAGELYEGEGKALAAFATPPLKRAVVSLPEGMSVNPSAAQGLAACTLAEAGISAEGVPDEEPARCPQASQYGTLTLRTPILPETAPLAGRIYVAQPYQNPFGSFLALYLVFEDPSRGILVKIPGRVALNEETGRITTEFDGLPQLPASEVELKIKSGVRAGLVEPQTCGQKTIEATFYSWQEPTAPHTLTNHYEITQNPGGSPCHALLSERPFDPSLLAGTRNPLAGSYSPLELRLTRTDADQELSVAQGTAPPGLVASLKGISRCSDAQIEAAAAPGRLGEEEIEHPSCPAQSQVGSVEAGAGVGQALTFVEGKLYLAGPYKGAPVSGVAIVPAVAGPFDLGTVVTRAPAYVDPRSAQITLKTDPLPQIFKGVPLRTRDIRVHLDREGFTLNPTSCEAMRFTGTLFSTEGKEKALDNRFQAADCASLGFKPRLSLKLEGATRRGGFPALRALYRPRPGDANLKGLVLRFPRSEFVEQGHMRDICTRAQFNAGAGFGSECPPNSVYGQARATSPLLEEPLEGPVYLRSNPAHKLPDAVVALHGPPSLPLRIEAALRIDSVKGALRTTLEEAPDAPLTEVAIQMQGGRKSLLVNSEDLCARAFRATAGFRAQNGRRRTLRPALRSSCPKRRKRR